MAETASTADEVCGRGHVHGGRGRGQGRGHGGGGRAAEAVDKAASTSTKAVAKDFVAAVDEAAAAEALD